jgi:hypothetical protein
MIDGAHLAEHLHLRRAQLRKQRALGCVARARHQLIEDMVVALGRRDGGDA